MRENKLCLEYWPARVRILSLSNHFSSCPYISVLDFNGCEWQYGSMTFTVSVFMCVCLREIAALSAVFSYQFSSYILLITFYIMQLKITSDSQVYGNKF